MPTLTRLLLIIFIFIAIIFSIMVALVIWVEPITAEMHIDVPLDSLNAPSKKD
ncbi:hypothetical protein [Bartonella sp. A05]|uniref:hypothetical protein n=1 Tax=Bartonella sp. A05 TaxID=2967261 RepID=UPI0022A97C40|nr:hypothetical protein [Bartonella sp. A05]MCZ2203548.1 hypothetical protein [Bartonella sp. A05]